MFFKTIVFFALFQLFWFAAADLGSTAEAKRKTTFKEMTATTSETHLLIFGTLENSFTKEMTSILHSGIALKFSFFIELYKITENWPEEQVATCTFQHIMNYDTLKENYRLTLEEENNMILSFKSLAEAQKVLNEVNGAKVVALSQLLPDNRYKLKMRAELYQKTLPLSLHNVLPFLSWWDVATDWHSIEFQY
jgi:Domain of unknown function (DUF4390)